MKGKFDFDRILYHRPRRFTDEKEVEVFIGVDTEAYTNGKPFMICTSQGEVFKPSDLPHCFFHKRYDGTDFVVYNMQYDSGALLRFLPPLVLADLHENECITYRYLEIEYIPHKYLSFAKTKGKRKTKREFWDIAQYFESSLDRAAQKYLGEGKIEVETKRFTPAYVTKNWQRLSEYCVRDAQLTARLAEFFKAKLNEFGLGCIRPYSAASLSYAYFKARTRIVNVWRYWTSCNDLLRAACEAYQGGKFEITARGSFVAHEYDIVSAYPYEIANLADIRLCRVVRSKEYLDDCYYAFIRCRIRVKTQTPIPHAVKMTGVQIYPIGTFYATLTKNEYLWMTASGFDISILDGYYLMLDRISYPYRKVMDELFILKQQFKGKDDTLYAISKRMINGIYGKFCQLTEQPNGDLKAGPGWNPIYSAVITANTRLRVTEFQRRYGKHCLGVHTDSILLDQPLPDNEVSGELGGVKLEISAPCILIACGLYQIGEICKYRGFEFRKNHSWRKLLLDHPKRSIISYPQQRVISWTQAVAWGKPELINVFETFDKKIDLNCDIKRIWFDKATTDTLLSSLEYSAPRVITQNRKDNPYA